MEIDFLKGWLQPHRRTADAACIDWTVAIHWHIEEQVQAETVMSVGRMCAVAKLRHIASNAE